VILIYYGPAKRSGRNLPASHSAPNPPILRRPHARSETSIAILLDLLQIALDWSDFHLHRFAIRGEGYGVSRLGGCMFATHARKVFLSQFRFRANERFLYHSRSVILVICGNIRSALKA
jgi:hypothetical protein